MAHSNVNDFQTTIKPALLQYGDTELHLAQACALIDCLVNAETFHFDSDNHDHQLMALLFDCVISAKICYEQAEQRK